MSWWRPGGPFGECADGSLSPSRRPVLTAPFNCISISLGRWPGFAWNPAQCVSLMWWSRRGPPRRPQCPEAPMASTADHDPRHHTQKTQRRLKETIDHLREDIEKFDEPQLNAMFETSAEILGGQG